MQPSLEDVFLEVAADKRELETRNAKLEARNSDVELDVETVLNAERRDRGTSSRKRQPREHVRTLARRERRTCERERERRT